MARTAQNVSTVRYLPESVVTNAELTERFTALGRPTVIDRLASSTGIMQRFYARTPGRRRTLPCRQQKRPSIGRDANRKTSI